MKKLKSSIVKIKNNKVILVIFLALVLMTLLTSYYGSTDIGDYLDVAKFFSGDYQADIRSSHSYLYGYLSSFLFALGAPIFIFKLTSLIFLFLMIYSVYRINHKSKKTFYLALLSPVVWYLAPWINPIQLASLLLLWSYYFIKKSEEFNKSRNIIISGVLLGFSFAIWDSMLFFGAFFLLAFFFNRKLSFSILFLAAFFIGLAPRLLLDYSLFNFPFYSILKSLFGTVTNIFGGIYNSQGHTAKTFVTLLSIFLAVPIYYWTLYKPSIFKKYKKEMIFLSLSLLLILGNPQIRYVLVIAPIIFLLLGRELSIKQYKRHILVSSFIILLFILPYIIQIFSFPKNTPNDIDFTSLLENKPEFTNTDFLKQISSDLKQIELDYPNQVFIVGNGPDDYALLARVYSGKDIKEFVSIQDYDAWSTNLTTFFEKTFYPTPNINTRRDIWISGGIGLSKSDKTQYQDITLGLSILKPLNLDDFAVEKKYNVIYLSREK